MKKLLLAVCTALLVALTAFPVMADSERVVTLGANLTMEEQQKMLRYFGAGEDVRIIYVTNEEERALLGDYIPLSVIGTRTLSCAYVKPTSSGGIQVKTANLNWVTSNMIASALSTAGVRNCEVIAACPKEVSGTGALAGVLKAYENTSAEALDPNKKIIAAQEIATVSNLAEVVGQNEATQIINEIKIEIIEDEVDEVDEDVIYGIVEEVIERNNAEDTNKVTEELKDSINELAKQIAAQNYKYEDVEETLARVEQNVTNNANPEINININQTQNNDNASSDSKDAGTSETPANQGAAEAAPLAEDSILTNTDESALGDNVITDATTILPEEPVPAPADTEAPAAAPSEGAEFEITTSDEAVLTDETTPDTPQVEPAAENPEADNTDTTVEAPASEPAVEEVPEEETAPVDATPTEAPADENLEAIPEDGSGSEEPAAEPQAEEPAAEPQAEEPAAEEKAVVEEQFNSYAIKVYTTAKPEKVTYAYHYEGEDFGEAKNAEKPVIIELKEDELSGEAKEIGAKYAIYIPSGEISGDCSVEVNLDELTVSKDLKYTPSTITVTEVSQGVYTFTAAMPEGAVSSVVSVNDGGSAAIDDDMYLRFFEDGEVTLTATYFNEAEEAIGTDSYTIASLKEA